MFEHIDFWSHSGFPLTWKIDCDALTDADIEALAWVISGVLTFGKVVGIPTGGDRLAKALEQYVNVASPVTLLVDDVLTTGLSMKAARKALTEPVTGVVIFSRKSAPAWIYPLFQLWRFG